MFLWGLIDPGYIAPLHLTNFLVSDSKKANPVFCRVGFKGVTDHVFLH